MEGGETQLIHALKIFAYLYDQFLKIWGNNAFKQMLISSSSEALKRNKNEEETVEKNRLS